MINLKNKKVFRIVEMQILDKNDNVVFERKNILNTTHTDWQEFALKTLFNTDSGETIPENYWIGLDNRGTITVADTLNSLSGEPTTNNYARISVSSEDGFDVELNDDGNYQATTSSLLWTAVGGSFGPVQNVFISTTQNSTGYLLGTIQFTDTPRTLANGEKIILRTGIDMQND